ncbi:protein of unknown function [Parasphingorhabdus marina DSM 22363]|uniref:IrrE N-terminal-like domain-containing protein n=1 Tax=Parasphingorhabdus marina DSM 22363 TaxID=1123272 RepID=A0A1N6H1V1_9SPHN|nr:ImmA/IrrE family metallo-endopeptidase [Parasphingorhabdus marina]SIO13655.1 protein of unknown function [Parasphingorhabdus marina DSM 22363]
MAIDVSVASKKAQQVLKHAGISGPPVPIKELAITNGCKVKYAALDDELSGMALIAEDQQVIVVNATHHPNRQRFTLAHELGHHLLHGDFLRKGVHVDKAILKRSPRSSRGLNSREIEANAFAAELLMPTALVNHHVSNDFDLQDEKQLQSIARLFGVSSAALSYRIIKLRG